MFKYIETSKGAAAIERISLEFVLQVFTIKFSLQKNSKLKDVLNIDPFWPDYVLKESHIFVLSNYDHICV